MSRYSFVPIFVTSSDGAAYFAVTTRSWAPGKYRAATNAVGSAGSGAAVESIFAASSACVSALASAVDLDSCAAADVGTTGSRASTDTAAAINGALTVRKFNMAALWYRYGMASSTTPLRRRQLKA